MNQSLFSHLQIQLTQLFGNLSERTLYALYEDRARLWIDTGDHELRLTIGLSEDFGSGASLATGAWVNIELDVERHAEDMRQDADGSELEDSYRPAVDWIRGQLLEGADDFAMLLIYELGAAEPDDTALAEWIREIVADMKVQLPLR